MDLHEFDSIAGQVRCVRESWKHGPDFLNRHVARQFDRPELAALVNVAGERFAQDVERFVHTGATT